MTDRLIVLGATSAMAEATARLYAAEGASIMLAARNAARLSEIAADLKARGAVNVEIEAPARLAAMAGRIGGASVILLAYGVLGEQQKAEGDIAHTRDILAVNFTSAALWCQAAASMLEAQKSGALVVIGSVAGDRGRQSNYVYGAAKAGLGVLVQGIAHRLALRGGKARAVLVKPGFVASPMTAHLPQKGPLWATPDQVARVIRKAADGGGPIIYAPWFWKFILLILRIVPAPIFHKRPL